jgi:hypothetical protein
MPTVDISGISVELTSEAATVVQRWIDPLQTAAKTLLMAAPNFDSRVQPALESRQLAGIFRGLADELVAVTRLFAKSGTASDRVTPALLEAMQDLIQRYIEGFAEALGRLQMDWEELGRLFFLRGSDESRRQYALISLASAEPLPEALRQGGRASFIFNFNLRNVEDPTSPPIEGRVIYLPRDVERDCALIGDTTHLCASGGPYVFSEKPCGHPWCQSIAQRIGGQLGEPGAVPTCVVWPARPASSLEPKEAASAYGYREYLGSGTPDDFVVSSERAPDVAVFYRTLGRQLGLAYAFCIRDLSTADFLVHRLRPYWLGLAYAFDAPFTDLRETGMFDPPLGPLAPAARTSGSSPTVSPAAFGLAVKSSGGTTQFIKALPYGGEVKQGCTETLESLAALADELAKRFELGRDLLSWFRPRVTEDAQDRQGGLLELLSATSSWSDWKALDGLTSRWRTEDDEDWVRYWFGGLLAQLAPTVPLWSKLPQEAVDALAPLRDRITGALGVRSFQEIRVEGVLTLAPSEREALWGTLVSLAQLLGGLLNGTRWDSGLDASWGALPVSILAEFELADHTRARFPYFVHRLQSASLWSGETGEEVKLLDYPDAPPPRLARPVFFPEPMTDVLVRRMALLKNEGVRIRLTSAIPALMTGGQSPRLAAPAIGPAFQLTPPSSGS